MAIVQTLPVPLEAVAEGATQLRATARSSPATMGSVGSLLPVRPRHDCAGDGDPSTVSFCKQEGLLRATPEEPRVSAPDVTHSYANGGFCDDWLDASSPTSPCSDSDDLRDDQAPSDHLRGPPPKLVPVSGKLEEVGGAAAGWVGMCCGFDFTLRATLVVVAQMCEMGSYGHTSGVPGEVTIPMLLMSLPSCQGCLGSSPGHPWKGDEVGGD